MSGVGSGIVKWRAISRGEDYLRLCGQRGGVVVGLLLGQVTFYLFLLISND